MPEMAEVCLGGWVGKRRGKDSDAAGGEEFWLVKMDRAVLQSRSGNKDGLWQKMYHIISYFRIF